MGLVMRIGALVTAVGCCWRPWLPRPWLPPIYGACVCGVPRTIPVWSSICLARYSTACSPLPHLIASLSTSVAPSWLPVSSNFRWPTPRSPVCARPSAALMTCAWSSICRRRYRQRALPWRLTSNMAIAWWSICSIRAVRPRHADAQHCRQRTSCAGHADPATTEVDACAQWQARYRRRH